MGLEDSLQAEDRGRRSQPVVLALRAKAAGAERGQLNRKLENGGYQGLGLGTFQNTLGTNYCKPGVSGGRRQKFRVMGWR